jgi:dipeptidyl aminopeptidase/acylaminoacyl peptidase
MKFQLIILTFCAATACAQNTPAKLTVEKIMRDPKWIGTSPSNPTWSADGKKVYFSWNPDNAPADSLYYITKENKTPVKVSAAEKQQVIPAANIIYNKKRTAYAYVKDGDIFYATVQPAKTFRVLRSADHEFNPQFSFNDSKLVYNRGQNLYAWDIVTGETIQLTQIQPGSTPARGGTSKDNETDQEKWLKEDQLRNFKILRERNEKREATEAYNKNLTKEKEPRIIGIDDKNLQNLVISPDGRFVSYRLFKSAGNNKGTIVPNYVTESGFTTDIPARTKVGELPGSSEFFVYDRSMDSVYQVKVDSLPGIKDWPDYTKDYPAQLTEQNKKRAERLVSFSNATWSPAGDRLLLDIRSQDNKDRWLMVWDSATKKLTTAARERNEAWVGGPGFSNRGWIDATNIWYQSEASGYSHIYRKNVRTGATTMITSGNYEVQEAQISTDHKYFYVTTNEVHPGEKHFYRVPVTGGKAVRLTTMEGSNQAVLSPDEKTFVNLYSYSNKPTELFWQENAPGKPVIQVTNKATTDEFRSYAWRDPELVAFKARDGATVFGRLYQPSNPDPKKPAVIFVHGAGYLLNAHKWWSSYFREYMFHNLLADEGYFVMDIDYRGSAGYGRDWRTGIYRHMGGKDLTDNVDAAAYMVDKFGVDKNRIGIYGGSYGGFITLMGLFTTPDVFAAGAALRPVTDWANYNHGYTANILNEPFADSIAYRRSSPLYYAAGLKNHLLICHGMVDVNVHYQDVVKLTQRLIELGKENWELASYPVEDHGFVEPSSWTDEYKRIFKLFETVLKK